MNDQVLSIQQMQHLKELGVDVSKASLYVWKEGHGDTVISNGNAPEMEGVL